MLKVLLPVDGSEPSRHAIKKGIEEGLLKGKEIHVITVVPGAVLVGGYMVGPEMEATNQQLAEDALNEAKALLADYENVIAVSRKGDPGTEILHYASEIGANLIVMGHRGLGTFSKIFLGSVSSRVLNHSNCSVLIVKS